MKRRDVLIGLAVAVLLAALSFLASSSPDGLERIAQNQCFFTRACLTMKSPIPDYVFPGMHNEKLASVTAGVIGVVVVFLSAILIGRLLKKR